jgi:hypothetical protein
MLICRVRSLTASQVFVVYIAADAKVVQFVGAAALL